MAEHGVGMRQFGEIFDYDGQTYRIHPDGQFAWASDLNALHAQVRGLRGCLEAIRDYEPSEIAYDEFAYKRMVESYRDAAEAGLSGGEAPDPPSLEERLHKARKASGSVRLHPDVLSRLQAHLETPDTEDPDPDVWQAIQAVVDTARAYHRAYNAFLDANHEEWERAAACLRNARSQRFFERW